MRVERARRRRARASSAPSTSRSTRRALPLPPLALAQQRHHRAARGELDRPDRDPAQPAHAGQRCRRPRPRPRRPASRAPRRPEPRTRPRAAPRGSGTAVCGSTPTSARPAAASIAMTSSPSTAACPGPPPHATTRPGSHETCSWSSGNGCRVPRRSAGSGPTARCGRRGFTAASSTVNRDQAAASRRCSDSRRRAPGHVRRPERLARRDVLLGVAEEPRAGWRASPRRSASRTASCSGVASPSASASTHRSNCHGATSVVAGDCVIDSCAVHAGEGRRRSETLCLDRNIISAQWATHRGRPLRPRRDTSDGVGSDVRRRALVAERPGPPPR